MYDDRFNQSCKQTIQFLFPGYKPDLNLFTIKSEISNILYTDRDVAVLHNIVYPNNDGTGYLVLCIFVERNNKTNSQFSHLFLYLWLIVIRVGILMSFYMHIRTQ